MVLLLLALPTTAQEQPPLIGELLALNTVEQDAIILYDIGSDSYRTLSAGSGAHHVWDFSADGCRVLFTLSDGTNPARLLSMALDGSDIQPMVTFDELAPEAWGVWEPDWSPDGSQIAFTMIRDRVRDGERVRDTHIAYVQPPNTVPEFYSVTGREFTPLWSPDSAWLVYVSYDERAAGENTFATAIPTLEPPPNATPAPPPTMLNEADMWVVSANGETKYRLTNFSTGSISQPRWSFDSELVSFVYSPSPNNDTLWMIANQQGAIPTQLNYQWVLALDNTWLPDATGVIAALRDFRDISANSLWQLPLVAGPDDNNSTLYLSEFDLQHADYPRFSPNGRYLAVRSAYELHLIDLQANERRVLDNLGNSPAVWSPEGFAGEANCP